MRADRLLSILLILQTRGQMTAKALSEELEVSERTIYRDLDALSIAGIPVYTERGPQGGIALVDNYRTSLTGLTAPEVQALFAAILPDPATDLGTNHVLKQAVMKLTAALPAVHQDQAEAVRQRILLDNTGWFQIEEPTPYLTQLQDALWECKRLKIKYRRADGQWVTRLIDPYGLVAKANIWYVVASTMRRVQVFRVSRIQEVSETGSHFERDMTFHLEQYWVRWCERLEQRKDSYAVTVKVPTNRTQDLVALMGDSIYHLLTNESSTSTDNMLIITLTFSSVQQAKQVVLGLGTAIEVIEPIELRDYIRQTSRTLLQRYRKELMNHNG